ncbi:MAG: hypothetical protein J3Q66DRAFT_362754 [Benniella sp.]|nr:MAG: hypothetical protein J3Q66DRAFT_362754 [Benniella sp.]
MFSDHPTIFLPAYSDSNGVATEASVDVTMTTPETTAPPTPAATFVAADAVAPPDARQPSPHRSQESQTTAEEARTEATRQKVMEVIDQQFDLDSCAMLRVPLLLRNWRRQSVCWRIRDTLS